MAAVKKLLIANRGEIALRIIRSARIMGLRTVGVYSEADADAAHVAAADEAYPIGPSEASKSYLNARTIIDVARASGADAIHPGYGFLSERPEFAQAVNEAGLVFVGPPADAMAALGDKVAARRIAIDAGVPVVPGSEAADAAGARAFAARVGYPIMVKAVAGGGGRGMRIVEAEPRLESLLEEGAREAKAAFGDGRIFLEKYLPRPRHVEIQVLADNYGKVVALGERECSIQRRYQKIVEESPAPRLSRATVERLTDCALRLAAAVGYRNAGTFEFLVEGENFYFLEANARLQVEHPVTELRFGCDLVAEQLRIAGGERLSPVPSPRGSAIECRINAEDPENDFRPATGTVNYLRLPAGPGVRIDTHLSLGGSITSHYDGLLAKLICLGETREQARGRILVALGEFSLAGIIHNAAFLRDLVASEPFAHAALSTAFIEEHLRAWKPPEDGIDAALIAALLLARGEASMARAPARRSPGAARAGARSPWRELAGFELWMRR